jgi:hypothetical protein
MSIPTIKIGDDNWAVKLSLFLGYNDTNGIYIPREFTVSRGITALEVNSAGILTTANNNIARIDYLNFAKGALFVEASAQNLAFHSELWRNGNNWGFFGTEANATGAIAAPNGTITANALSPTAVSGSHFMIGNNSTAVSYTSGNIYTQSAFFKAGTGAAGQFVQLTFPSARFTQAGYANFDLIAGTVSVVSGSSADANRAARIENYGNGWYRCIFTATCDSTGTGAGLIIALITSTGSGRTPSFDGITSDVLYSWGAQVETGAIATSYIPTTTGIGSRAADTISLSNVSNLIGQTEGTIYAEVDVRSFAASAARRIVNIRVDGNNLLSLEMSIAGNSFDFVATSGGVGVTATASGITTGIYKIAVGYNSAASGTVLYVNGVLRDTKTIAIPNLSAAVFGLGVRADGGAGTQLNDRIRAAAIYTSRLSNDNLMLLTLPTNDGYLPTSIWNYYLSKPGVSEVSDCLYERYFNILNI